MSINKGKKNLPHNLWLQRLPFSYPAHYKSFQLLQSSAMICVIRSPAKKRSKKSSPINHDIDVIFKISDDHTDPKKQRQDLLRTGPARTWRWSSCTEWIHNWTKKHNSCRNGMQRLRTHLGQLAGEEASCSLWIGPLRGRCSWRSIDWALRL